jgi:hypothetical protein
MQKKEIKMQTQKLHPADKVEREGEEGEEEEKEEIVEQPKWRIDK